MAFDTCELRNSLIKLLRDVESGAVSNSAARARVTVAKAILDTVKVEIAAAALGTSFGPVALDNPAGEGQMHQPKKLKLVKRD